MTIIKKVLYYLWLHIWKYKATERQHCRLVSQLRGKPPVKVVFIAIDLALWRYQHLYELMVADNRFIPTIVLSPSPSRKRHDQDIARLRHFFDSKRITYVDYCEGEKPYDIKGILQPDIIFYPQPYEHLLCPEHDCMNFYDRLTCYASYYFPLGTQWAYNFHFTNFAWRIYYSQPFQMDVAKKKAFNNGRNVRIVGYANADDFLKEQHSDSWKQMSDGKRRKRIIWAPHHTISISPFQSNFLWMAELMINVAKEYSDQLQIAFKPHPNLLTQLYRNKQWGKERTDAYYKKWDTMRNTQLETGDYVDLFMTSDAMIHDSASFIAEYHYSQHPVMFVSRDKSTPHTDASTVGLEAYEAHYMGDSEADIRHFINHVVLGGKDPLKTKREAFFHSHLLPPNNKSVAQNILDDITESLNL